MTGVTVVRTNVRINSLQSNRGAPVLGTDDTGDKTGIVTRVVPRTETQVLYLELTYLLTSTILRPRTESLDLHLKLRKDLAGQRRKTLGRPLSLTPPYPPTSPSLIIHRRFPSRGAGGHVPPKV